MVFRGVVRALGAFLILLSALWLEPQPGAVARGAPTVGAPAPGFALKNFDGTALVLKNLVGKVVILNFWASWCPLCRVEMPILERMWTAYKERDVVIVGINSAQDTWSDARAFLRTHKVTYANVRDETGRVAATYGVVALPTTYFIGRDGRIQERFVGAFVGDVGDEELGKRIEVLLR